MLADAKERGLIDAEVLRMLEGVLEVSEIQVRDVMVPRSQMVVVQRDDPPERLLPVVIESGHSRFPVVGEDRDEVIGILLAKDLLRFFAQAAADDFDIRECVRPAVFMVPFGPLIPGLAIVTGLVILAGATPQQRRAGAVALLAGAALFAVARMSPSAGRPRAASESV